MSYQFVHYILLYIMFKRLLTVQRDLYYANQMVTEFTADYTSNPAKKPTEEDVSQLVRYFDGIKVSYYGYGTIFTAIFERLARDKYLTAEHIPAIMRFASTGKQVSRSYGAKCKPTLEWLYVFMINNPTYIIQEPFYDTLLSLHFVPVLKQILEKPLTQTVFNDLFKYGLIDLITIPSIMKANKFTSHIDMDDVIKRNNLEVTEKCYEYFLLRFRNNSTQSYDTDDYPNFAQNLEFFRINNVNISSAKNIKLLICHVCANPKKEYLLNDFNKIHKIKISYEFIIDIDSTHLKTLLNLIGNNSIVIDLPGDKMTTEQSINIMQKIIQYFGGNRYNRYRTNEISADQQLIKISKYFDINDEILKYATNNYQPEFFAHCVKKTVNNITPDLFKMACMLNNTTLIKHLLEHKYIPTADDIITICSSQYKPIHNYMSKTQIKRAMTDFNGIKEKNIDMLLAYIPMTKELYETIKLAHINVNDAKLGVSKLYTERLNGLLGITSTQTLRCKSEPKVTEKTKHTASNKQKLIEYFKNMFIFKSWYDIEQFMKKYNMIPDIVCFEKSLLNSDSNVFEEIHKQYKYVPSTVTLFFADIPFTKRISMIRRFYPDLIKIDYPEKEHEYFKTVEIAVPIKSDTKIDDKKMKTKKNTKNAKNVINDDHVDFDSDIESSQESISSSENESDDESEISGSNNESSDESNNTTDADSSEPESEPESDSESEPENIPPKKVSTKQQTKPKQVVNKKIDKEVIVKPKKKIAKK